MGRGGCRGKVLLADLERRTGRLESCFVLKGKLGLPFQRMCLIFSRRNPHLSDPWAEMPSYFPLAYHHTVRSGTVLDLPSTVYLTYD
ncbi:MAG: hypothetical protein QGI86_12380 [Candidatus Poribacteria bacterium]|nr:hypothetical protein [Candidatus Poribacteria bacterium]